jgi:hypothetical protein
LTAAATADVPPPALSDASRALDHERGHVIDLLDRALADVANGGDWLARVAAAHAGAREAMRQRPDAFLYLLVHRAGHSTEKYASSHAVLAMIVCELAAAVLGWSAAQVDALGRAALLMNVAILRLQDQLAAASIGLTSSVRREIARHPEAGAALLRKGGLDDELVLDVVRRHHGGEPAAGGEAAPAPGSEEAARLASLLQRVDIFTAKISRRATRPPMSPVLAARQACVGADGKPDEIGAALLKAVGMYPPGSYVELVSGELAIVLARGRSANRPRVASLIGADGAPLAEPILRDTFEPPHGVKRAALREAVRFRPPHERLLAMR